MGVTSLPYPPRKSLVRAGELTRSREPPGAENRRKGRCPQRAPDPAFQPKATAIAEVGDGDSMANYFSETEQPRLDGVGRPTPGGTQS